MINFFIERWENLEGWERMVLLWSTFILFMMLCKSCGNIVFNP